MMKYIFLLCTFFCSQTLLAQYFFKYDSDVIGLENISNGQSVRKTLDGYLSDVYKNSFGDTLTIEPVIALTIRENSDITKIINQYAGKLTFAEKLGNVYYLNCNAKNSEEVLSIISQLCVNENVIACDAVHTANIKLFDALYSKQYYLNNIVQNIDIRAEAAWKEAPLLGKNTIVAVIDQGVDFNHEDLPTVIDGYTVGNVNGKGEPANSTIEDTKAHGVACAGIIGAANNSLGIRGIASRSQILPINIFPTTSNQHTTDMEIAKAIRWASERADILSCSWGHPYLSSVSIHEAIKDALTNGRNGKGCVIVCASGNDAQTINGIAYPASEAGVISVGAVDRSGKIWDFSQRGEGLTLVAPSGNGNSSSDIVTTDRMGVLGYTDGNYTEHFGGTSAACPQVAGVAALMLSLNPDLTATEVKEILQNTATDLGDTGYDTTYGYGLVNAYAAVSKVFPTSINGPAIARQKGSYSIPALPSCNSVEWSVPATDVDKVKITTGGDGNSVCTLELNDDKTVRTTLLATIIRDGEIVKTITKTIGLISTFSGNYSVSATSTTQPISNRPFVASSTIQAYSDATVTAWSDDFYYYSASLSGQEISNWTYGNGTFSFTVPKTTAGYTYIKFTPLFAGGNSFSLKVYTIKTSYALDLALVGNHLSVCISKKTLPLELEENAVVASMDDADNKTPWTIDVFNMANSTIKDTANVTAGVCLFNISTWAKGNYLVRATNGCQIIIKKIIIP